MSGIGEPPQEYVKRRRVENLKEEVRRFEVKLEEARKRLAEAEKAARS